jgi:type VI secretion system protein
MARERSFLERLRAPEPEAARTITENTGRLAQSVLDNLRRLLNSRQGIAPTQLGYGIPDLCDVVHDFPDAVGDMRKAIKLSIERFEPRLRKVSVKHVEQEGDPLALHFEITAELVTQEKKASIWIETRVDNAGMVEVKG